MPCNSCNLPLAGGRRPAAFGRRAIPPTWQPPQQVNGALVDHGLDSPRAGAGAGAGASLRLWHPHSCRSNGIRLLVVGLQHLEYVCMGEEEGGVGRVCGKGVNNNPGSIARRQVSW